MKKWAREINLTHDEVIEIIDDIGYNNFKLGYSISDTTASDILYNKRTGWGFDHIERIDVLALYNSDYEASLQAQIDGLEIIFYNGIGYIKTDEVLKAIKEDVTVIE